MPEIDVQRTIRIDASSDQVWKILADEFDSVGSWSSSVTRSSRNTELQLTVPEATSPGRVCAVPGFGNVHERVVAFDATERTFTFEATADKIPSFVTDTRNTFTVTPTGGGSTVETHLQADARGLAGSMVAPMMKRKFAAALEQILEDLRIYAESGRPSEAKRKALARA